MLKAIPQNQSSKAGDQGGEGGGHPRLCCSSQEPGTEGLGFTAHVFADFSAFCRLQAFTSQEFIQGDPDELDLGSADLPRQTG